MYRDGMSSGTLYDRIGERYAQGRQADPHIAARILEGLGAARSVVNVGAGAGSYEPADRRVVAVEPSDVMIRQRPAHAAPVVRAAAEQLPFRDDEFDAALAVLTIHHWTDLARGLAELRRVARDRAVIFTRDRSAVPSWWLYDYFPATDRLEATREFPFEDIAAMLGSSFDVIPAPIPADCTDGFNAAYWRRPEAFLDPGIWPAMSAIAMIPEQDRAAGMLRLRTDLDNGRWADRWGHLLALDELDLGYRVFVASW
jgi:SAM-dependent methyltransferase